MNDDWVSELVALFYSREQNILFIVNVQPQYFNSSSPSKITFPKTSLPHILSRHHHNHHFLSVYLQNNGITSFFNCKKAVLDKFLFLLICINLLKTDLMSFSRQIIRQLICRSLVNLLLLILDFV